MEITTNNYLQGKIQSDQSIDNKPNDKSQKSFNNILKNSLQKVNQLQHNANQAGQDLAIGKSDNIHEVMIAAQKANLSLNLTTAITNKAVDAYKEVMRMQV